MDEKAPLAKLADPAVEVITGETYGALKALCEAEVRSEFADGAFTVRPGLLVGPHDPSGRFTYWVRRIAEGGDVLAPGDPDMEDQFIDTRDAAAWMVRCAEERVGGVQNMTGPRERLSMRQLLDACRDASQVNRPCQRMPVSPRVE